MLITATGSALHLGFSWIIRRVQLSHSQKTGKVGSKNQKGGHQTLAQTLWSAKSLGASFLELLWNEGCNGVREYVDAGELAQWLHHNEPGVNKEYSQKLASQTIDALTDLTKGRLYVKQKNRRKDGLSYKERRVVLPEESEIPGETTSPETADVGSK